MKIVWYRHAESLSNQKKKNNLDCDDKNTSLTLNGVINCIKLRSKLQKNTKDIFSIVYVSIMERAIDTGLLVFGNRFNLIKIFKKYNINNLELFLEKNKLNFFEWIKPIEIIKINNLKNKKWINPPVKINLISLLNLLENNKNKNIALITHNGTFKLIFKKKINNLESIETDFTSLSELILKKK